MQKIFIVSFVAGLFLLASCSSSKNVVSPFPESPSSSKIEVSKDKDGSSFKKAVVAESVPFEYEYVKKVCFNCQFIMQSLEFEKGVPYDILTFEDSNGKEIKYYFDISSFFGKGF